MKKWIGLHLPTNTCNLSCSYCYVNKATNKLNKLELPLHKIKRAFAPERLGGCCFINICSNGETLMPENVLGVIQCLAEMGHYIMILSNGTLTDRFKALLCFPEELQKRIFIKFSFHYEELKRKKMLDIFFNNVNNVKKSDCSLSVEMMACDEWLGEADEIKRICLEKIGALPHVNIPRDERQYSLGVLSKYSLKNFIQIWKNKGFESEFFDFRAQTFGKHVDYFCYAGIRSIWINMKTGDMMQCYHTTNYKQDFFDLSQEIEWLPVGNNCCEPWCYNSHAFMTTGVLTTPEGVENCSYFSVRNRHTQDGYNWVKPEMRKAFEEGVEQIELTDNEKKAANERNALFPRHKPNRDAIINRLLANWLAQKINHKRIGQYFYRNGYSSVAIYGYGELGQLLEKELKEAEIEVRYIIDRNALQLQKKYSDKKIITKDDRFEDVDVIVITPIIDFFKVKAICESKCNFEILSIENVIYGNDLS